MGWSLLAYILSTFRPVAHVEACAWRRRGTEDGMDEVAGDRAHRKVSEHFRQYHLIRLLFYRFCDKYSRTFMCAR